MRAGGLGGQAGLSLFLIGQQAGLQDDLDGTAGGCLHHALDIPLHQRPVSGLGGAHMDDHIQLLSAHGGTAGRFGRLLLRGNGAQREPHHAAYLHAGALQPLRGQRDIHGVDADAGKVVRGGFGAQLFNLLRRRLRL